ncbi:hypothetical protein P879_04671 [Paragonimus westermani]|uniref:Uncharacterized protein n=1 Tax=Paragonimus westermani TaxID=34504 RepID=A0A8T0DB90_9TREM|nr:hypothetical protein P879_04671 [Paragonimus westermani]
MGGYQKRLRCQVPQPTFSVDGESIYDEHALDAAPYIPCATVCLRLLPYTKDPIPNPPYRERTYQSDEACPSELEWVIYRLFQSDREKTTFLRVVLDLSKREGRSEDRQRKSRM